MWRTTRTIPEPIIGANFMSSSSITFPSYVPSNTTEWHLRLQSQMRTWLPALACAMVFAVESTQYLGADRTSAPLQRLAEAIFGYDACVHWDFIHHLIRKTGHFMGYGIFSLVCFRGFWITLQNAALRLLRQLWAYGLAILATFLVAGADELHQSLLPNRTGQFSDVLLDCCGAAVLCFVLFLGMQAVDVIRQARARAACSLKPAYAGIAG
jgi:VanZ family protein